MREGEYTSYSQLPVLIRGYREVTSLPPNYEKAIRFASILINIRALVRSLLKRPPNRFTQHQVKALKEDIAELLISIP